MTQVTIKATNITNCLKCKSPLTTKTDRFLFLCDKCVTNVTNSQKRKWDTYTVRKLTREVLYGIHD